MNLLYFGDMHIDKHPSSRIDYYNDAISTDDEQITKANNVRAYKETQINKINEIKKVARDYNVKALLQGGDFLNKDIISSEQISYILEAWQGSSVNMNELLTQVKLGQKPIEDLIESVKNDSIPPMFGVAGNHELTGNDIGSLEKTSLNLLVKSGFMTFATKENPIIIKDEAGFTVAITGSHYTHDIDDEDKSAYIVDKKLGDYHIHIVHGMLMEKDYGKKFKHTTISEIAYKTKADLTINGHDHIGYELTEVDGKLFVNPGSPFRLSAEKKEIARMPKILILEIDKLTGIKVKEHYLKSAKKGDLVLSRNHISRALAKSEKLEEIEDALNKAHLGRGFNITDIVKQISINDALPEEISSEAVELITTKMRELDTPFNPKGDYIIQNITLENFLCHKHTSLDFEEGLNVLYGESRSGKSSILRAIREVYECYLRNPRDFIFYNEDFFRVTLTMSNGYVISRYVEKKKNGKNGYEIYDPIEGEVNYYNTKAVSMVQEILGLNKIKLTEKNKIGINFLNQGESWFFIGNGLSAPDKAKLTGVVYGTHYADGVLKDITAKTKKITSEINFYEKEIKKLEEEKSKYAYLDEYEELLVKAEEDLKKLEEKEEELEKINKTSKEILKISKEIEMLDNIIKEIEERKPVYEKLFEELSIKNDSLLKIMKTNNEMKAIISAGKEASMVSTKLKDIELAKQNFNAILELNKIQEKDINAINNYNKINKEITSLRKQINILDNINSKLEKIKGTEILLEKIRENTVLLNDIKSIQSNISVLEKNIETSEKEVLNQKEYIATNIEIYKKELSLAGKCPVCNGNINSIVVDSVVDELNQMI